mmetsp:Transcript_95271/g.296603  ORF Transcript_95271/g.296603 Transcript_95271/m.296603 type:complete len:554 (-) Transcript_95271:36-1697(-)|eukprot:CAMPEP_0204566374 /NCGR_PEP_ID=MMETSP0661-20131031/36010_1 /ASSEMBLY_ACC=CAM_ASM_000606 /TAXON_ID=109239 /ORGANISM="Alexandrium margalefi, Strain AMGDE01CS-322" /LENGTH=553 /DNA_ID=CAMNT_0051574215 /DNA_START=32 /DNA_END=1693 /DNA_ORIENTATION=+
MTTVKFNRWDKALKQCMSGKKGDDKGKNRWNSDPMVLNTEAHELPAEKQRVALDFMEQAPPELRAKMAPIWKYCFAQWHIYDAGLEALEKGNLQSAFEEEMLQADVDALVGLFESGDLEKAQTTEKWTWKLLEPFPPAGSVEWSEETAKPMIKVGREERREGVMAFEQERYDKAFWHFWQGLKLIARAPDSASGPHAKLRADLWKNRSAAALKLKMPRTALGAATAALAIDMRDEKAWFRKSCALEELGQAQEAKAALAKAGLAASVEETKADAAAAQAVVTGQPQEAPVVLVEEGELEPPLHGILESLLFVEIGVNSITAVDLIMHIQSELKTTPIPLTIIFDCPKVREAVTVLLSHINAADELYYRRKMNGTVWRALCRALGRDPVQDKIRGRQGTFDCPELGEAQALSVLADLKLAYEDDAWIQKTRELAKRCSFEQRPFLVSLRPKALEVQRPILEKHDLDPDLDGLRNLEIALVRAAQDSSQVADLLQGVRMALQGGPNGMWAVNMDTEAGFWDDSCSMQSRIQYTKADPFGPRRINTNSAYSIPRPL